jgi:23S rRNA maturation mini-RNase III
MVDDELETPAMTRYDLYGVLFGLAFGMIGVAILDWYIRRHYILTRH